MTDPDRDRRPCPWCGSHDTDRIGDAGSLLMTEQWFCDGCSSAFEVIRKRGSDGAGPSPARGPIVSVGRDPQAPASDDADQG